MPVLQGLVPCGFSQTRPAARAAGLFFGVNRS